jgi:hypothetical protein
MFVRVGSIRPSFKRERERCYILRSKYSFLKLFRFSICDAGLVKVRIPRCFRFLEPFLPSRGQFGMNPPDPRSGPQSPYITSKSLNRDSVSQFRLLFCSVLL